MTAGQHPSPPEAQALALFEDAACGLLQTSADGTILRVNRTFAAWVGQPADALLGRRKFQDLLTMGGRIFHQTHWAPLMQIQGSISEVKLEIVHADGSKIPMVCNAIRHESGGRVVHDVATFVARDRDKYEQELVRSRTRLEELVAEATRLQADARDRALFAEQMIGIVSHDLRNPMSSIQVGTVLLGRGEISPGHQRVLARVSRSVERANRLIADLLDFTQARLGKGLGLALESIDLHGAIAEAVDELALGYPGRTLKHVRAGEGPCTADPNRLAQLVGNLVSNAMTYGRPDAPVTVTSTVGARTCAVAVHNDGAPIPDDARAALFQAMTRGTHATRSGRSVGLGLIIVSEIAKAHGGAAVVESTVERGTTFTVTWPRT